MDLSEWSWFTIPQIPEMRPLWAVSTAKLPFGVDMDLPAANLCHDLDMFNFQNPQKSQKSKLFILPKNIKFLKFLFVNFIIFGL